MDRCLSEKDFETLISGTASKLMTVKLRQHLRVCDTCAVRLAEFRLASKASDSSNSQVTSRDRIFIPKKSALEPNVEIGDFRIKRRLGAGGMGVVYEAYQKSLNRRVALKVLGGNLLNSESAVERFGREARASAKLHHPNIVSIYEEGIEEDVCYYAMELVEGKSVGELIEEFREEKNENDNLSKAKTSWILDTASSAEKKSEKSHGTREHFNKIAMMVAEAADALEYAHQNSVIHRDIKPSNLMISNGGRLKITDFGIARVEDDNAMTVTGTFLGSPLYMSPEQLKESRDIDHRTDIYSLGVTLYELLTLKPLFEGLTTHEQAITHILNKNPAAPRSVNEKIPVDIETICCKAIEAQSERRYQSAGEFAEDLRRFVEGKVIKAKPAGTVDKLSKFFKRHKTASILSCCMIAAASAAVSLGWKTIKDRRAEELIPQVTQLIEQEKHFDAFLLAKSAESIKRDHPMLEKLWPRISSEYSVKTEPAGVDVYIKDYYNDQSKWIRLGRSPIGKVRIPLGRNYWKFEKKGYNSKLIALSNGFPNLRVLKGSIGKRKVSFTLQKSSVFPEDMVWISSATLSDAGFFHHKVNVGSAPAYLIDKYEVTNKQFKEFIDQGGYANVKYWDQIFIKDGKLLSWKEAMALFVDSTGKTGPASWSGGTYEQGHGDYPVCGVSWYEAAAYAKFRGKDLPTVFHWLWAAMGSDQKFQITQKSNFGNPLAPVGTYKGMGLFGLYDCGGNVREWCYNAVDREDGQRCIFGGAWSDTPYMFKDHLCLSPWNRDNRNGFRCAKYIGGKEKVPQAAFKYVKRRLRNMSKYAALSEDQVRRNIETFFQYDKTELKPAVESEEELEFCRLVKVSYNAAYPERIPAFLFFPKDGKPPYNTVIWFPGSHSIRSPWTGKILSEVRLIVESGRVVILPFYNGTYDRIIEGTKLYSDSIASRNLYIQMGLDMRRTVDYIESRNDLNCKNIAYAGYSWGGSVGPFMMAIEDRIKTGIYLLGGISGFDKHPVYDAANYLSLVKAPVLMINGKDDSTYTDVNRKYMFEQLGTDEEHKKQVLFPGGHSIAWQFKDEYNKIILDWLDKYQGNAARDSRK